MGRAIDEGLWRVWRERLARYQRSGQTVSAFCAGERVAVPTFYQWKRKLEAVAAARSARSERESPERNRPTFVPVHIAGSALVEIELPNGVRVRVPSGDVGALSAVIAAVGRLSPQAAEEASPC
jgi:transposase